MARPSPGLLSLPRELRDSIYGFCTRDIKTKQARVAEGYSGRREIQVQHAPYLPLLVACRQIFREYRAVARKNVKLLVIDWPSAAIGVNLVLQDPFQRMTRLELHCLLICPRCHEGNCARNCRVMSEAGVHVDFIKRLASQMSHLKTMHLRLDVWWPTNADLAHVAAAYPQSPHNFKLQEQLGAFAAIAGITSIEVTRMLAVGTLRPFAVWHKDEGWRASSSLQYQDTDSSMHDTEKASDCSTQNTEEEPNGSMQEAEEDSGDGTEA